jgi:hypothetical protein
MRWSSDSRRLVVSGGALERCSSEAQPPAHAAQPAKAGGALATRACCCRCGCAGDGELQGPSRREEELGRCVMRWWWGWRGAPPRRRGQHARAPPPANQRSAASDGTSGEFTKARGRVWSVRRGPIAGRPVRRLDRWWHGNWTAVKCATWLNRCSDIVRRFRIVKIVNSWPLFISPRDAPALPIIGKEDGIFWHLVSSGPIGLHRQFVSFYLFRPGMLPLYTHY